MVAIGNVLQGIYSNHLRLLNVHHDLLAVADLVELCFASTMDADGREYLRQMRQIGRDEGYSRWMLGDLERSPAPFSGFVWEEDGRLVGNLSLIPLVNHGKKVYFIANVAVHPEYRRRGIARALTRAALQFVIDHHIDSVWLQVRQDNPDAYGLYLSEGFIERARRYTWLAAPEKYRNVTRKESSLILTRRLSTDWELQQAWLNQNYPPEVAWNLPLKIDTFKPSFLSDLGHFLNGDSANHWAFRKNGRLVGIITFEPSMSATDNLWMASDPASEEQIITDWLPFVLHSLGNRRPLSLNFPASKAETAFQSAGLILHQPLIWMEINL